MKKRFSFLIAIVLTVASMISSVTTMNVDAAGSNYVATDGTNKYTSWDSAVKGVKNGGRLTALKNGSEMITIPAGKTIELDFGSYMYTRGLTVEKNATLNVVGGTYEGGTYGKYLTCEFWTNYGTINISKGNFNSKVFDVASHQEWGFNFENYGKIKIKGGTFTGTGCIMSRDTNGVWGNTYISGGTFAKGSLGNMSFTNGNYYETNQHVFISKGTFCNDMKSQVKENLASDVALEIIDLGNGSFKVIPETKVKVGDEIVPAKKDKSGAHYIVESIKGNTATVKVTNGKKAKGSISIPSTVKDAKERSYKVTTIAGAAYKNNKKITAVAVGKNVTNIGKESFRGAAKLSSIKLNGNTLNKVGKDAFKSVKKNCKITITAKNKKTYNNIVKKIKASGAKNVKYVYKKGE